MSWRTQNNICLFLFSHQILKKPLQQFVEEFSYNLHNEILIDIVVVVVVVVVVVREESQTLSYELERASDQLWNIAYNFD